MRFVDFARDELGLQLTHGQRVLCLVAFDGLEPRDLEGEERETARALFGDVDTIPALARGVLVLLLGRVSGKTLLSAAFALYTMATADVSACGPGDVPTVVVLGPTRRLAGLAVRAGLDLARRSPRLRRRIERETSDGFALRRRDGRLVAFEAVAASRGGAAGRGVTILVAILDEAQFFLSDEGGAYAVTDRDAFAAIKPRARRVIFISTPWPVPTLMGELFERNWQAPATAVAARAPTLLMRDNDEAMAMTVDAERQRDPSNAAREFDCDDDGSGGGAFFDPVALAAAVDPNRPATISAPKGAKVAAGGDLGLSRDDSCLAIVGEAGGTMHLLELLELRPERGVPLKLSAVIRDFATVTARHGCRSVTLDGWSREPAREHAEPLGLGITSAPEGRPGKEAMYLAARSAFAEGRIKLPPNARLMAQLRSVTARPAPGGSLSISQPRRAGSHGDLVSALVAAIHTCRETIDTSTTVRSEAEADAWEYGRGPVTIVVTATHDAAAAVAVQWIDQHHRGDEFVYVAGELQPNPAWFPPRILLRVLAAVDLPLNVRDAAGVVADMVREAEGGRVWMRTVALGGWKVALPGIHLRDATSATSADDAAGIERLRQLLRGEELRCDDPILAGQLALTDPSTGARVRAMIEAARLDVAGQLPGSPASRRYCTSWQG